jgi:hypothetical protein
LTTTMMTMAVATATRMTGGTAEMPDRVGDEFEAPLKGTRQNSALWGSRRPPRWDWVQLGVGGVRTLTTGLDNHCNPNAEKNEEGIEGGEDGRTHAHDFEWALYMAQFLPPMLPRGQRKKGVDQCRLSSMPG